MKLIIKNNFLKYVLGLTYLLTVLGLVPSKTFAQSLVGGSGGGPGGAAGGASSALSGGAVGSDGVYPGGGGGGGSGTIGGQGGSSGSAAPGGYGGLMAPNATTSGWNGFNGAGGGGGGGGGAVGATVSSSASNVFLISGGSGGSGGVGTGTGGGGGGGAGGYGVIVTGGTLNNSGAVSGGVGGGGGNSNGGLNSYGGSGGLGVYLASGSTNLVNSGSVQGGAGGAAGSGGVGGTSGTNAMGVYVASGATSQITNTGTITSGGSGASGISNAGTVSVLNNSQGVGNSSGALTYTGTLPTNYNIIVNSASSYGQLSLSSVSGQTTFGITSSTLATGTYLTVLSGLVGSNIINTAGTYTGGYAWSLVNSSGTNWNLVVTCPGCGGSGGSGGGSGVGSGDSSGSTSTPRYSNLTIRSGTITSTNNNAAVVNNTVVVASGNVVTGDSAITNTGTTPGISNSGIVSGTNYGLVNAADSTIVNLTNSGIISGGTAGIQNLSPHTIDLLVNTGMILGGIDNTQGRIIVLQNAQGGAIPLTLSGNLPNNYQVIVNGLSSYGQLAVSNGAGQMRFGIANGSVVYTGLTYTAVLTGVSAGNLLNTSGSSGGYLFKLLPESSGNVWDLRIGASVYDTQSSLQSTASALQPQFQLQANGVIAGLSYDCSLFGENGICISAGGRQTGTTSFANGTTSALLIGAYKINDRFRVGGYLDQNLSAANPNGIISNSNSTPMGGLFAVWNDRDDGLGTEVKASLGYNNKGMTITRPVVGTSEPGSGSTTLTSQGANVVAKYHFGLDNRTTVSPYIGARYLSTSMNGYSEGQASNVLVPLAYSSLSMNATTALAGVGANHRLDDEITLSASAGIEADIQTTNGSYTVTNVNGLSPVALNPNPNKVRPTATAAAYYKLHKDAQIGLSVLYRQDSMTGMSSTTGIVTYTMGM